MATTLYGVPMSRAPGYLRVLGGLGIPYENAVGGR